ALPMALAFSIPWAALVSIMLVFGRLSADNEITAMRACGISILQITAPIIVLAFLLSLICLYLNMELANRYLGMARSLVRNVIIDQPMTIFEPGIPVKYADLNIYIGAKEGNVIRDIQVYRMGKNGKWEQDVTAHTGKVEVDREKQILHVILNNATVAALEGKDGIITTTGKQLVFSINYGDNLNKRSLYQSNKFLPSLELLARIGVEKKLGRDTTKQEVQFNGRIALALSPIAFLLLGLPLAIRTSRRETSVGLFLSVLLAGVYFGIIMLSDVLDEKKNLYPQYIVWLAPILYQIFGAFYLFKIARR
ncbi:MAG: LptF/LptG family permease, partial [Lentisphaeria bacterium]|nr:LptF/LptG family permease [Lentisphaeria bacterium]